MKKTDLELKIWEKIYVTPDKKYPLTIPTFYENVDDIMKTHNISPEFRCAGAPWDHIYESVISQIKPKIIFEIGSYLGYSAIKMAEFCKQRNIEDFSIVCIDPWLDAGWYTDHMERSCGYPTVYYKFLKNVKDHSHTDVITPLPMPAITAYKYLTLADVKADLIYIDGSHDHDDVYMDITRYYQLLNPGGIIFGDDWSWSGVQSGVALACQDLGITNVQIVQGCWILQK